MGKSYNAADITVLDGMSAVRKRPAMYIGGTDVHGLHHLLWEIVDNSTDEAINGHADTIEVILDDNLKTITVSDNGRGIPVDKYPKTNKSTLEVILTTLHAGGKFENSGYKVAGGLHGVGSSVVNALSIEFLATISKDGHTWEQSYSKGTPTSKIKKTGDTKKTGTTITFTPDPSIFDVVEFDPETIRKRLKEKAILIKGLKIKFKHLKQTDVFESEEGISDFLKDKKLITQAIMIEDENLSVSFSWTEETNEEIISFANTIKTKDGGTHEQGLRDGVIKAIKNVIKLPKMTNDDIKEGFCGAVSVFVTDPQFQGQTKDRIQNQYIKSMVSTPVFNLFQQYLLQNPSTTQLISNRIERAIKARVASRSAKETVRKSYTGPKIRLPGKLADCSSTLAESCELFIVEGDSAGGNAKQGRDRRTQAILPLRGKVLNAEQSTLSKITSNKELSDIIDALGCGIANKYNSDNLRYHKVILLMDADSDGHHITTLLLSFFWNVIPQLIQGGHLYIAQPPLFRVNHSKGYEWVHSDKQVEKLVKKLKNVSIQRFKGLGEMMADDLKMTTLDPDKRQLLKVVVKPDEYVYTDDVIGGLMGKDASVRFEFISDNATSLKEIDL